MTVVNNIVPIAIIIIIIIIIIIVIIIITIVIIIITIIIIIFGQVVSLLCRTYIKACKARLNGFNICFNTRSTLCRTKCQERLNRSFNIVESAKKC